MFHGVIPVQGGAHRPWLEEWLPFSRSGTYRDDTRLSTRFISENPDQHQYPTPMCHSHRSSPLTSAQTSVVPKKHHSITRLIIAASKCFHVFDAAFKAGNINLLHPCATLLCYNKLLQSLKSCPLFNQPIGYCDPLPTRRIAHLYQSGLVSPPYTRLSPGSRPVLHRIKSTPYSHATQL
nr:MAG TPA: hypothetical protein [Caudoviricetes sp.]